MSASATTPPLKLPIIDFSAFLSGSQEERAVVAEQLVQACHEIGFVYIQNHGMSEQRVKDAFGWARRFFALEREDKLKAPHPLGFEVHRGYSDIGREKLSKPGRPPELREAFDVGSPENHEQPNIWVPDEIIPGYRAFMEELYMDCFKITTTIFQALQLGLKLKQEDHLVELHPPYNNQLRMIHYPAIPAETIKKCEASRMPTHADWSSVTILFQDLVGGLEVKDPAGGSFYIPATPIEGTLIMNVGDVLDRWSNGYLKSNRHRVTLPPTQDGEEMSQERFTIVYFADPTPDESIERLPIAADSENPTKYPPFTHREWKAKRMRYSFLT